MLAAFTSLWQFWLVALTSIFFLVDPFAAIPAFLAIAGGEPVERQRHLALRASITCFVVLSVFAVMGPTIFRLFGLTLPAFEIAGGLILLLIGLDMLQARRSAVHETPGDAQEGAAKSDAGVIPLGMPMLAGPGAISAVMVLIGQSHGWLQTAPVMVAIVVTSVASYLVLAGAAHLGRVLGQTGIRILTRLMGLLLTAIAVQFFLNGLRHLGALKPL
ncbi:MAG TPA: MarC family protein [Terriglobia bacterium]|nr:MarC family protein [Terriglobia bacterium]